MSKVLVFRFERANDPGYFGRYLDRRGIPYQVIEVDRNEPVPSSIDGAAGLVFMGGIMSVNDDLHWIPQILDLIRAGQEKNTPMLGHCLGGQLISKALGGAVKRNPVEEIGWLPVRVLQDGQDHEWCLGLPPVLDVFSWHNETFSIPPAARHIFSSEACPNQGFQIRNTLALQFHLEITAAMVEAWSSDFNAASHTPGPSIQTPRTMTENLPEKIRTSHAIADQIYENWCNALNDAYRY